ncbi:TPA: hypothetical protein ACKRS0_002197 [Proteus mirabilis]
MIYTTGTVSTVSGSTIVSGTGTKWTVNNPAIRSGTIILIKNGNANFIYMVDRVNSDTELVISQPATFTVKNTSYSINLTEPNSYSDANNRMTAIASDTTYFLRAMDQWMMNNGVVTVELSNGQKVTLDSIKKMQGDIGKKLSPGDFGVGSSALNSDKVNTPTNKDANNLNYSGFYAGDGVGALNYLDNYMPIINASRNGGGDGTGSILQIQATSDFDNGDIGFRRRSNNIWNGWQLLANRTTSNTQAFNGQVVSYSGLYSFDKNNSKTYFGFLRANTGDPFGFYCSYNGVGYSVRFQEKKSGTIMLVGDYGLGTTSRNASMGSPSVNDIKALDLSGFFSGGGSGAINLHDPFAPLISASRAGGGDGTGSMLYIQGNAKALAYCYRNMSSYTPWINLWGSSNTTVDSNGFIKRASPVININPDGTFTTNDESEGATVTRVAQGEYLIDGVLGFNSDAGWGGVDGGIEIPLDVNKQPLIWVDSKVMEDGSILVRTYHRTHPNAPKFARNDIDGYKDGDPIDIPDGRFISVRVQMPEQSIYNVRMREMEETQKAEEERRQKEED